MLTKQDKDEIKDIMVDVIQDVVMPAFEIVATKEDLEKVEQRLDNRLNKVENRLESVEMKLDRVAANQLEDRTKIKKLESRRLTA